IDKFGRRHNYLRLSLTERCNLRCTYCMPENGIQLSPNDSLMNAEEIEAIVATFVDLGISKIRLTGGEPLLRKDFADIATKLSRFNIELALTTNGILVDQYLQVFKDARIDKINISLDSLKKEKFVKITRRDYFDRILSNIDLLFKSGIKPKINVVVIKNENDDEIIDFIRLTQRLETTLQFIEFMPFQGNKWDFSRTIKAEEIIRTAIDYFGNDNMAKIEDGKNDTSRKYKINGYKGNFGIISTVTNPFCDTCNRIRLTANGRIKNCLFSNGEVDILSVLRKGEDILSFIQQAIVSKKKERGGIEDFNSEFGKAKAQENRSMILIGG
ncbi:MAG: GTP 3',8-cyclase MoaA, partial [Bacteroidia bacterium]